MAARPGARLEERVCGRDETGVRERALRVGFLDLGFQN